MNASFECLARHILKTPCAAD